MYLDNYRTSITCSHVSAKSLRKSENKSIWLQLHVWLNLEFHALQSVHSLLGLNLDTGLKSTFNLCLFCLPPLGQTHILPTCDKAITFSKPLQEAVP